MKAKEKWQAIAENNPHYDGVFYYALKTTGIFCRPSCKSKQPLRKNVLFFDSLSDAQQAGFRACKRCRPDLPSYNPDKELAAKAKLLIENFFHDKETLGEQLQAIGLTRHRLEEIFKEQYSVSLHEYSSSVRIQEAKKQLAQGEEAIAQIAYAVGFESIASFYRFFKKHTATSPAQYRKAAKGSEQV